MKTNIYWVIAGILNFLTFIMHLTGGQIELVDPMLETSLATTVKAQLVGAWHMVSIILLATSIVLILAGFKKYFMTKFELIAFIAYLNLSFCLPFIIAGFYYGILVPQWIFFLPIAVLTFIGIKKNRN